jgi:hypothetical protein
VVHKYALTYPRDQISPITTVQVMNVMNTTHSHPILVIYFVYTSCNIDTPFLENIILRIFEVEPLKDIDNSQDWCSSLLNR